MNFPSFVDDLAAFDGLERELGSSQKCKEHKENGLF